MPSFAACRCPFRLMRRYFLGRWICLLVSEGFRLVWWCRLFNYSIYIPFCVHWHGGQCLRWLVSNYAVVFVTNNSIKHQSFVNTKLNYQTILYRTIQFSISQQSSMVQVFLYITSYSIKYLSFDYTQLNYQTVLFLNIQFIINHLFALNVINSIWPVNTTISGATSQSQSGPENDRNEGV